MFRLALERVAKVFRTSRGNVAALEEVSLTVDPGEFVLLKGPSGAGKSTLLFIAGALLEPTAGAVRFEGRELYRLGGAERSRLRQSRVHFVFQSFHLIPYLTAEENVLAALTGGASKSRQIVEPMFERFGLMPRRTHLPGQLSVGERQRLALVRALAQSPSLILADEPTGNLDPENTSIVRDALAEHCRSGGSVLMATHSDSHDSAARKVVTLRHGRTSP